MVWRVTDRPGDWIDTRITFALRPSCNGGFEKVDILARAFAHGAKDGAKVDDMLIVVDLVRDLEVPHIRVLAAVYNSGGNQRPAQLTHIRERDPGVSTALVPLLRRLEDQRMVVVERKAPETGVQLDEQGFYLAQQLEIIGVRT